MDGQHWFSHSIMYFMYIYIAIIFIMHFQCYYNVFSDLDHKSYDDQRFRSFPISYYIYIFLKWDRKCECYYLHIGKEIVLWGWKKWKLDFVGQVCYQKFGSCCNLTSLTTLFLNKVAFNQGLILVYPYLWDNKIRSNVVHLSLFKSFTSLRSFNLISEI